MSSIPIIEEIDDDMKQLELSSSDKRKIISGLKQMDSEVTSLIKALQKNSLTEVQSNLILAAINAKRYIREPIVDKFLDEYQIQLQKLDSKDRDGFLLVYNALVNFRLEMLEIEAANKQQLQLAAYKAGYNPLALDEMKLQSVISLESFKRSTKSFVQSTALAAGLSGLVMYGLHKGTSSISLLANLLKNGGEYLSSYQACSNNSDASWLSYENLVCSVSNKVLEPIAKTTGALSSSIGIIGEDLREGGILLLGLILFLGLLFFIVISRKITSTKKLKVAFLGEAEFSFKGSKNVRKSLVKKLIKKSKRKSKRTSKKMSKRK